MNDTQLAYRREGEGVALVLVHGYLGAADMWNNQVGLWVPNTHAAFGR